MSERQREQKPKRRYKEGERDILFLNGYNIGRGGAEREKEEWKLEANRWSASPIYILRREREREREREER